MNILIVGSGSIGKRHLRNFQLLGFSNIWVLKRKYEVEFEKEYKTKVITTFDQAIQLKIDILVVATPTSLHNEALKFAVDNDIHVFMEKPLIHTEEGLDYAKEIMRKNKKVFFIGFMLRFHPLVQEIKMLIENKSLGSVYSAKFEFGSFLPFWHPYEDYKTSYASRKELGGGVINTICHELDLIQFFFGEPEMIYCSAKNLKKLDIEVEEVCDTIFEYPDKIITLHLDYLQKDYDRNIKILCDEGKIIWDWQSNIINVFKYQERPETIALKNTFEVNLLYISELKHFLNLIKNNQIQHSLDFNHASKNTSLLIRMHQSVKTNKKIINNL